jgi:hypothetical protein
MSAIRKEMHEYISALPDSALLALRPLLALLTAEEPIIETDLTEDEKAAVLRGRAEYAKGGYISLSDMQPGRNA